MRKKEHISDFPFHLAYEHLPGMLLISNLSDHKIIKFNKELCTKLGFNKKELLHQPIYKIFAPDSITDVKEIYEEMAINPEPKFIEAKLATKNKDSLGVTLHVALIKDSSGKPLFIQSYCLSQERYLLDKIEKLAKYDVLTTLPNRHFFNEELSRLVSVNRRTHGQFALLLMDLDHFKSINEIHGHEVGDKLLIEVANRCRSVLRKNDFLARLSGDEFVILLQEISDTQTAGVIAKKLLSLTQEPFSIASFEIRTSLSIGIVIYSNGGITERELLKDADVALFRAKKQGSKKYSYFNEKLLSTHMKYINLQYGLLSAMDQNEFYLLYQPQVNLVTKKIIGIEALLRWKNEKFGLVLPEEFIPIAEKSGLMNAIGDWVFQNVCMQIQSWRKMNLKIPKVSINLSTTQLNDSSIGKKLMSSCKKYKVNTEQIALEITETAIMNPMFNPIKILKELDKLGFYLSIDDFGTGYSSLSRLSELPISALKIDKSFLKDFNKKESDIVIRSILTLAQNLELNVIAEGVETQEGHDYLLSINCLNAQGYFYHLPIEAEKIQKLLLPK